MFEGINTVGGRQPASTSEVKSLPGLRTSLTHAGIAKVFNFFNSGEFAQQAGTNTNQSSQFWPCQNCEFDWLAKEEKVA